VACFLDETYFLLYERGILATLEPGTHPEPKLKSRTCAIHAKKPIFKYSLANPPHARILSFAVSLHRQSERESPVQCSIFFRPSLTLLMTRSSSTPPSFTRSLTEGFTMKAGVAAILFSSGGESGCSLHEKLCSLHRHSWIPLTS
jgi:hypothetical protein